LSKELGAKAKGGADAPLEPLRIVLLRHGESEWNASKRFSGWVDIDLTDKGRLEAARAGKLLKLHGYEFDEAHASVLKRAVRTLWTALHSSNQHWIPVKHTWRLNERHYGALTGLSKTDAEEQLGKEMLLKYRRGYAVEPLPMTEDHPMWTGADRRYRDLGPLLPMGESLRQCHDRVLPYWYESIVPSVRGGKQVLVAAHNNVIRCLCKHLDGIADDDLRHLEIPTGFPLVYHLDPVTLQPIGKKDAIGFSGSFLTDPTSDKATAIVAPTEKEPRAKTVDVLFRGQKVTAEESLREFVAHSSLGGAEPAEKLNAPDNGRAALDTVKTEGEASSSAATAPAAATAAATREADGAAPATASVPMSVAQHAMLDEELRLTHGREYDLEATVKKMRIDDVIKPQELEAEARKLGLGSCARREAFAVAFAKRHHDRISTQQLQKVLQLAK